MDKTPLLRDTLLSWTVYVVECGDGTLYTGITTDLPRRLQAHADGKGAKYTRGRGPFSVFYTEMYSNKSEALQREAHIKRLDARCKRALISNAHQRP
jgi:putative endonuclease